MSIANTQTESIIKAQIIEDNDQVQARVEHLRELERIIGNSYPNKYERSKITGTEDTISNILNFSPVTEIAKELKDSTPKDEKPNQELKESLNGKLKAFGNVRISGRLAVPPRVMGKAAFVHLSDGKERLQIYVRKQDAKVISNDTLQIIEGEETAWEVFKLLDHGDFIGAEGYLFLTNTGELSVHVETFQFLSKALLPMPDKLHGIADPELRRRYRYADLIASSLLVEREAGELTTREVFERRAKLISGMRNYLDAHGYIEVETPMLTPKATGAAAKPFETHHNALDIPLYARIAPELYLKRLTVGGFEKVYELNRNFRNEGLSQRHNPEFTMLEFYCAYMDVSGMMDFAEAMIQEAVKKATGGSLEVKVSGEKQKGLIVDKFFFKADTTKDTIIDFSTFERLTMKGAIKRNLTYFVKFVENREPFDAWFETNANSRLFSDWVWWTLDVFSSELSEKTERGEIVSEEYKESETSRKFEELLDEYKEKTLSKKEIAKEIVSLFEAFVEATLIQPTFIIDYPKSISPLSKASPANPQIAERFELFINGMECANGFSELNDPQEQYERFIDQMKEREGGDEEAMVLDEDYIRALSYGMPPAAGIGIGIDRLVMLLTNKHSIRDVILFPHMRPILKEELADASEQETEKAGGEEGKEENSIEDARGI